MVPVTLVTAHLLGLRASEGLIFYFLPLYTTYLVPLFKLSNVYLNYLLCLWVYTYSIVHLVVCGQLTEWSQFSLPPQGPGTETPNLRLREHLYPLTYFSLSHF